MTVRAQLERRFYSLSLPWQMACAAGVGLVVTNVVGAGVVFWLIASVLPLPDTAHRETLFKGNLQLVALLLLPACAYGYFFARRLLEPVYSWLGAGQAPSDSQKRHILSIPRRVFLYHALGWTVGSSIFITYNAMVDVEVASIIAQSLALAAVSTSSAAYLVAERLLRPLARAALRTGVPLRVRVRTVAMRTLFAWALGTIIPVVGIILVGIRTLNDDNPVTREQLSITMIVLAGLALLVGGFTTNLAARASSDPVRALRQSLARVGRGDLNAEVQIYDGTEIGLLQAGFNEMLAGLREREKIQDLFGRHVGADVARAALDGGVQLGGESLDVGVLFVDIIGSTTIATERPPDEVVRLLNRFFDVVISVVHEHEGWINKFEGDAALAVWGAPVPVHDMPTKVLQAARTLSSRLRREVPELAAGVGVSAGVAVAGNVGAAERYEYTVIGDPVNEAARLTELAKDVPGHVIAQAGLLEKAPVESEFWQELEPVVVRGRTEPTRVAIPLRTA